MLFARIANQTKKLIRKECKRTGLVMRTPEQLALAIRRQTDAKLDQLADEVMRAHENREDQCTTIPLERRSGPIFRRPKTALIAQAAQRAAVRRQLKQIIEWGVTQRETSPYIAREDYSQAIAVVNEILESMQTSDFVEHKGS
jgi:hypothetical protein